MLSTNTLQQRKAKISLDDYPFRRDIETRLLMAQLSVTEVNVLREIIYHSLTISIEQLAEDTGLEIEELLPILDKLSATKLFKRQHKALIVDKEKRKYFEVKIEKFDENFRPDLEFLQSTLAKVPIHILPIWYAIPRSSDNIFESIIEKYFLTPKIYRQYLSDLQFDNPILKEIIQEVHQPPSFKVTVADLLVKFNLSHEVLEEYLLLLEYHFACCLSYERIEDRWLEVVTPFAEWHEYLQFEFQTKPQALLLKAIKKQQQIEFQFIKDLTTLLHACQSKKFSFKDIKNLDISFPSDSLIKKLTQLQFIESPSSDYLVATKKGKSWMTKSILEQVTALVNDPLNISDQFSSLWNVRNLRLVEKSLRRLIPYEWVEFESFLQGFIAPIGDKDSVTLKTKGKKWKYVLPIYTDYEKQFIQAVLIERLAELGVVETGLFEGKPCFCLTTFGSHFIQ